MDGTIEPQEWPADVIPLAIPTTLPAAAVPEMTTLRIAYDDQHLYLGIDCTDSQVMPNQEAFSDNDSVFVGLRLPDHLFQFGATPKRTDRARFHRGAVPKMREYVDYTKPLDGALYRMASARTKQGWSVELALSWEAVQPRIPTVALPLSVWVDRRNINGQAIEVSTLYEDQLALRFANGKRR